MHELDKRPSPPPSLVRGDAGVNRRALLQELAAWTKHHRSFCDDFFDGLASLALERGTEHDCLPLLLALGFSHYQTTWSWPRSHHWQQWFSSPPPADWLAAFFWYLCWAVGDVDRYAEHYAAAQACLDRADWPELAAELRAYTIRDDRRRMAA